MNRNFLASFGFGAAMLTSVGIAQADVIISEVVDATLPGGLPKYVELTNTGSSSVNLADYSIGNFNNGGTTLGGGASTVLSGNLAPGDSYVISYENGDSAGVGTFFTTYGFDPDNFDLGSFVNGDDVIVLFLGAATGDGSDATIVDIYGVIGTDGTGEPWEYTDSYAFRNADVVTASATFSAAEWTIAGPDALETGDDVTELALIVSDTTPGTHTFNAAAAPVAVPSALRRFAADSGRRAPDGPSRSPPQLIPNGAAASGGGAFCYRSHVSTKTAASRIPVDMPVDAGTEAPSRFSMLK